MDETKFNPDREGAGASREQQREPNWIMFSDGKLYDGDAFLDIDNTVKIAHAEAPNFLMKPRGRQLMTTMNPEEFRRLNPNVVLRKFLVNPLPVQFAEAIPQQDETQPPTSLAQLRQEIVRGGVVTTVEGKVYSPEVLLNMVEATEAAYQEYQRMLGAVTRHNGLRTRLKQTLERNSVG